MERTTAKITLPVSKQDAVIKEWLTGREYEESQKPFYEALKKGDKNVDMQFLAHKTLESYVVSINGKTDNLLEKILDLPYKDYDAIFAKITELKKKELT